MIDRNYPVVKNTEKVTEDELRELIAERCPPGSKLEKTRSTIPWIGRGWTLRVVAPNGDCILCEETGRVTNARRMLKRALLRYHLVRRQDLLTDIQRRLQEASDYTLTSVYRRLVGLEGESKTKIETAEEYAQDGANRP